MSYTVLAVKWRPKRFADLVGQAHVVTALVNSLEAERLHHAYLFSGTRGVGKTTIARLLAKALNCETGISAEPCGECAACAAIDEGRFVDLIEVDAASRTKVDDTRELLDNVQYMPSRGRFKVYLIDEVHMLSNHSFNALLKTLEEPPPHVKFLFATTDPQKLPVTVLSRCLQFNLKKLPLSQIQGQLEKICAAESIEAESGGLQAIARAANGSMRDALSLLDQGIAFGGGRVEEAQTKAMLGTIDRDHVIRLVELLAAGNGAGLLDAIAELDAGAPDYGAMLEELMGVLQRVAVAQIVGAERLEDDDGRLGAIGAAVLPEDVQLWYQIAVQGARDVDVARDQRISFEMTLLRMLAFTMDSGAAAADAASGGRVGGAGSDGPRGNARTARSGAAAAGGSAAATAPGAASRSGVANEAGPSGHATTAQGAQSAQGATAQSGGAAVPQSLSAAAADWPGLVRAAGVRGPARSLADHCVVTATEGQRLELTLADSRTDFNTEQLRERLRQSLSRYLGAEIRLTVVVGTPGQPTQAEIERDGEDRRLQAAREAIAQDPTVRAMQAAFDAVLEPDSIRPAGTNGNK